MAVGEIDKADVRRVLGAGCDLWEQGTGEPGGRGRIELILDWDGGVRDYRKSGPNPAWRGQLLISFAEWCRESPCITLLWTTPTRLICGVAACGNADRRGAGVGKDHSLSGLMPGEVLGMKRQYDRSRP